MSQPASRSDLKEYALRRLGKPVLEINVDDDQIDDLIDDALQMFNERHYNGSERMFFRYHSDVCFRYNSRIFTWMTICQWLCF